jgi:ABC-type transport system involved in multi-copper enzyme maturation permease subunit
MTHLIHAELRKLRTTRAFLLNALAAVALVPISVASSILTAGHDGGGPALTTSEGLRGVISAASSGSLVVLILGILMIAGEFRHGTITSTMLISPDRRSVVVAKLVAAVLVGVAVALAASVVTLGVALPWLAAKGVDVHVLGADVLPVLFGGIAATALYALVGVGIGSLVRNQTAAVVAALVWVMVVEALLVSFVPEVGRWFPGGAAAALSAAATVDGGLLPMWGGGLLFAGYGLALAAAGARFTIRRDIV